MKRYTIVFILFFIPGLKGWCQSQGDYRSYKSGNWGVASNWEKYVSGTWVYPSPEAPPPSILNSRITIRNGHTITATAKLEGRSLAVLEINSGGTLNMGTFSIYGFKQIFKPPQNFPVLIVNGLLTSAADVCVDNFTVGSTGTFKTSYAGSEGWWLTTPPVSTSLNGTVEFNGNEGQRIPGYTYGNLIVAGSYSKYLAGTVIVSDSCTIKSGSSLKTNGKTLILAGSGIINNGQFLATSGGIVTFAGDVQSIEGTGTYAFPFLNISSSYATTLNTSISAAYIVVNKLTSGTELNINGKTLILNGAGIQIDGILSDSEGSGTVIMNTGSQNITGTSNFITFPNLNIVGTSTTLQTNITVSGLLTVNTSRTFNLNNKELFLTGPGILLNGTFNDNGEGAVYFDGAVQTISGTGRFNNIVGGIAIGLFNQSDVTLSLNETMKIGMLYINDNSFTIESNSRVEITTGLDIFTENGLILKSSANSSASLIMDGSFPYYGGNQKVKVERYMTGEKWQIISPSVENLEIQAFFNDNPDIPTKGTDKGMGIYDEATGLWTYFTTSTTGFLYAGTSYMTRTESTGPLYFSGTLSYMDKLVPVSRFLHGWNAVGNPFTSAVGITSNALSEENFLAVNASNLAPSYGAIYIWDEPIPKVSGANYYKIISNSGFIPPSGTSTRINQNYIQSGQGFLVRVAENVYSLSFTRAMQYHSNTTKFFKKNSEESWPGIRLHVKKRDNSAYTDITFHKDMTKGLDITCDAGLMGGVTNFGIYTRLVEDNGVDFGIQCLPDSEIQDMVIPIGLVSKNASIITFSAEIVPLPDGYSAILEDRLLGTFTDLTISDSKYEVPVPANTAGIGRFFLHTRNSATNIFEENLQKIITFAVEKEVYIKGVIGDNAYATLYDLYGRTLKTVRLEPAEFNSFRADELKQGIYILKIHGNGLYHSTKIFIE